MMAGMAGRIIRLISGLVRSILAADVVEKRKKYLSIIDKFECSNSASKRLQVLDAIDRRGSFAGASKELHRVPSTISYVVAKLEDDLGVQIFERMGPRVALTPAGIELLKEGRYLLKAAQDLEHRVRRVASGWETSSPSAWTRCFRRLPWRTTSGVL